MANNRLAALVLVLIAFVGGAGIAQARDSSLCAQKDPTGLAAGAKAEPCPEAKGEPVTASAARPVLRHDAAATTPVIAGPIAHARHFVYRLLRPEAPSAETIVLLHGSGGDEASLFKLALRVAPDATLLGVRGRIVQKGIKRWYARITPTEFDQADIRKEAKAFVDFLKVRMAAEKLDPEHTVFIGYSNGANLIAAVSLLYPDLIERAVLLRAMPVLTKAPETDLRGVRFLTVSGEKDRIYAPFAPVLEALLRNRGAVVDARQVAAGHLLGDEDVKVVSDWLSAADMMAGDTKR